MNAEQIITELNKLQSDATRMADMLDDFAANDYIVLDGEAKEAVDRHKTRDAVTTPQP